MLSSDRVHTGPMDLLEPAQVEAVKQELLEARQALKAGQWSWKPVEERCKRLLRRHYEESQRQLDLKADVKAGYSGLVVVRGKDKATNLKTADVAQIPFARSEFAVLAFLNQSTPIPIPTAFKHIEQHLCTSSASVVKPVPKQMSNKQMMAILMDPNK